MDRAQNRNSYTETVSARWIAVAVALVVAGAALCLWGALCLVFWRGSWQLLYHPASTIAVTPASAGLDFAVVDFATTDSGQPQLHGWWIPGGPDSRFTAIYLHGANGNIGDTVKDLRPVHDAGMSLLVFDYRGYGASRFDRPSEAHWRADAESAIRYLTDTRHIPPAEIVLAGSGLGANLALEVAAAHPELAGVVLDQPLASPEDVVFNDPRARLVPAHWLVADRWSLAEPSAELKIPSLWFVASSSRKPDSSVIADAYGKVNPRKSRVWLTNGADRGGVYRDALERWMGDAARGDAQK